MAALAVGGAPTDASGVVPALSSEEVPKGLGEALAQIFPEDLEPNEPETKPEPSSKTEEKPDTNSETSTEAAPSSTGETAAPDEKTEEKKDESEPASSEASSDKKEEPAPTTGPVLPAAYRRSLKAYEWTDDEIDNALKNGGDGFVNSAAKIHATRSKEVAQWAELGRKAKAQQQAPSTPQPSTSVAADNGVLAPIDPVALKKVYGDEPLIDRLVTPLNAAISRINAFTQKHIPVIEQYQQQSQQAAQDSLTKSVDSFFADSSLKEFHDHYGKESSKLSPEQTQARIKVLEMADALVGGANVQGRRLGLNEALQLAHDATSSDVKTQTVRQQIASDLQKRQAGMTLRPSARGAAPSRNPSKDLKATVKTGLKAAFG